MSSDPAPSPASTDVDLASDVAVSDGSAEEPFRNTAAGDTMDTRVQVTRWLITAVVWVLLTLPVMMIAVSAPVRRPRVSSGGGHGG